MISKPLYDGRARKGVFSGFLVNLEGENRQKGGVAYWCIPGDENRFCFQSKHGRKDVGTGLA